LNDGAALVAAFLGQHLCADADLYFFAKSEIPKPGRLVEGAAVCGVGLCADDTQFTCRSEARETYDGNRECGPVEHAAGNAIRLRFGCEGKGRAGHSGSIEEAFKPVRNYAADPMRIVQSGAERKDLLAA
jgi:hypothetical protein